MELGYLKLGISRFCSLDIYATWIENAFALLMSLSSHGVLCFCVLIVVGKLLQQQATNAKLIHRVSGEKLKKNSFQKVREFFADINILNNMFQKLLYKNVADLMLQMDFVWKKSYFY